MSNLENVLSEYLTTKTNYAFLINGKWGSGKTYYYKNHLTKIIESTPTVNNDSRKYRPVHISLFGLSNIEDIQTQIFLSLNTLLKNKIVKLSAGLGKSLAKGIFAIKNLGNFDDYVSEVKPDAGDWINIDDLVICFDDLERKSENLHLEELIGFINSLVENNDAKILIIANDNKISEKNYNELKEKTVGISIEFSTNFEEKLNLIIENRYKNSYESYYQFLEANKNLLLEYAESFNDNFRILIFVLDKCHTIYSELKNNILDVNSENKNIVETQLKNILKFSVAISIEYKKNRISYKKRNELEKAGGYADFSILVGEGEKKVPSYREEFLKEYFKSRDDYYFYETIYIYITGADKFIIKNFSNEIIDLFHLSNNEILPPYKLMMELSYQNVIYLTEIQYRKKTSKMVEYAEKGNYTLLDYLTIYHYATRFDNPLRFSVNKLKKRLLSGIKQVSTDNKYIHSLEFHLDVNDDSEYKNVLFELKNASVKKNDKIREIGYKKEANHLLNLFVTNWIDFQYIIFDTKENWKFTPFLQYGSSYKFYCELLKSDFIKLREFRILIKNRYSSYLYDLNLEKQFLMKLRDRLNPVSKQRLKKNLRNYYLNEIYEDLNKILIRWN